MFIAISEVHVFVSNMRFCCVLTVSVAVFIIIIVLVVSEVRYYTSNRLTYDYDVDPHFEG